MRAGEIPAGWWQASDGRWYPPETHPDPRWRAHLTALARVAAPPPSPLLPPPQPVEPVAASSGESSSNVLTRRFGRLPLWAWATSAVVALFAVATLVGPDDTALETVAGTGSSTVPTLLQRSSVTEIAPTTTRPVPAPTTTSTTPTTAVRAAVSPSTAPATTATTAVPAKPAAVAIRKGARIEPVTVARIVDGDTFEASLPDGSTRRVRLAAIDAPELSNCGGSEAAAALGQLISGWQLVLELGEKAATDQYDRLLAYVYRSDGVFVNVAIIANGYAIDRFYGDNAIHRAAYQAAQADAEANGRGATACRASTTVAPTTTARPSIPQPTAPQPFVPQPPPTTVAPPTTAAGSGVYYANCTAARAAGAAPLYAGDSGYRAALDRDSDGIACE